MALGNYSYSGKSFTPGGSVSPDAVFIKPDKTVIYVLDNSTSIITEYDLNTAGEIDTASASGDTVDLTAPGRDALDLFLGDSGDLLLLYDQGNGGIVEFDMSPSWDITSASASGNSLFDQSGIGLGFAVADSGSLIFILSGSTAGLEEYDLSTALDITSSSYDTEHSLSGVGFSDFTPRMFSDGSGILVGTADAIGEWPLSTANDLTSAGTEIQLDISSQTSSATGFDISSDDTRIYVADGTTIYQYNLAEDEPEPQQFAREISLQAPTLDYIKRTGSTHNEINQINNNVERLLDFFDTLVEEVSANTTWIANFTGPEWGEIEGELEDQIDLQEALDERPSLSSDETITGTWTFDEAITSPQYLITKDIHALTDVTTASQTRTVDVTNGPVQTLSADQDFTLDATGPSGKVAVVYLYVYDAGVGSLSITGGANVEKDATILTGDTALYTFLWTGTSLHETAVDTFTGTDIRPS